MFESVRRKVVNKLFKYLLAHFIIIINGTTMSFITRKTQTYVAAISNVSYCGN